MANEQNQAIKCLVKAKITGTGYPIDGQVLLLFDHGEHFGLIGATRGDDEADKAVMQTIHQTDDLYCNMSEEEFDEVWKNGEYEADGIFIIEKKNAELVGG